MSRPDLYLFIGAPGAGKTSAAQVIAEATGAKHLWADNERHRLFKNPSHSKAESDELYEKLNGATEYLLQSGKSVVFDTNFNFYEDRQKLREIADAAGAKTTIIWLTTPENIARERAVCPPQLRNGYMTEMTDEQFDSIVSKLEPPRENETVIKIDGAKLDATELKRLLSL